MFGSAKVSGCWVFHLFYLVLFKSFLLPTQGSNRFEVVNQVLLDGVHDRTFPGAVGIISVGGRIVWQNAVGTLSYDTTAKMENSTRFDLASLTKVIATTTSAMYLYERGLLDLNEKVASYLGPNYTAYGKGDITVLNLLLHNAGFPPDPTPQFWSPNFQLFCQSNDTCVGGGGRGPCETFHCLKKIYLLNLLEQKLDYPIGSKYVYSDLSMITLMYVVGQIAAQKNLVDRSHVLPSCLLDQAPAHGQKHVPSRIHPWNAPCYYEAFVRSLMPHLGLQETQFLPPSASWGSIAPACVNTTYRRCPMQGQVSDGNAFALGGISGHAGLFSPAHDLHTLASLLLKPTWAFPNKTTTKRFTTIHNRSQSSRALGWDTNDYASNSYRGCGNLSSQTFTHTGYTGTQVCIDPVMQLITVLLTNRCYPDDSEASKSKIHTVRQNFNNAAISLARPGPQQRV